MVDFELMQHQKQAVWKSQFERDLFLAWEMGTGKSCATINIIRGKCRESGRLKRTLILAPVIMLKKWKEEFGKYSNIDQKAIYVLHGLVRKRAEFVKKQVGYNGIIITNFEALERPEMVKALLEWGPEILVCDESHNLKNYKSKRAKNVAQIADICEHRYLLTGTPILNNAMDLFMQYRILDGGDTLGSNFFVYRSQYFRDENASWNSKPGYFPKWVPREEAYPLLMEKISKKTLRVTKEECLDLPPLIVEDYEVDLSPEQSRLYKEMEREYITFIDSERSRGTKEAVVARLAVTKALRLQQIVSGFVKTDAGECVRIRNCPRLDALSDLLESLAPYHKVIIWACFKENYAQITEVCKKLKLEYVEVHGDVSERDKYRSVERFNNDGAVRVLIGNQGAGGVGIDLVSATYSIYYSRDFKLGNDLQSQARNHRRGSEQHSKITRINLVSPGTIDELVAESLEKKLDISEQILSFTNQLTKERKSG